MTGRGESVGDVRWEKGEEYGEKEKHDLPQDEILNPSKPNAGLGRDHPAWV